MPNTLETSSARTAAKVPDYVPTDYSDLFNHYYPYVRSLVYMAGIVPDDVEDVSMSILTKFIENDVLADYDPEFVSEYEGVRRIAAFRTFLSGFVRLYLRHYYERQITSRHREPLLVNSESRDGVEWAHKNTPVHWDSYDELYVLDMIRHIRHALAHTPEDPRVSRPLLEVFDTVLRQVNDYGKPYLKDAANELGISHHTMGDRMRALHVTLNGILMP